MERIQESRMLLRLLVDAVKSGWRDASGGISKNTVCDKILHVLNERLECEKTYKHYQNRLKILKQRYLSLAELVSHSSGFGWDPITKKFTASDEVWDNYFKSHPNQEKLRTESYDDYEDLAIVFSNGTAVGKHSIAGGDAADDVTYVLEERRPSRVQEEIRPDLVEEYGVDDNNEAQEISYQNVSTSTNLSPFYDTSLNAPSEKLPHRKKPSIDYEATSSLVNTTTRASLIEKVGVGMDSIVTIATEIQGMRNLLEKREKERESRVKEKKQMEKTTNIWEAIKEAPNLDKLTRFKALDKIHKLGMKDAFLKMSPEERSEWI